MNRSVLIGMMVLIMGMSTFAGGAEAPMNIIVFGAHPDDCELDAGGVAAMWAEQGHRVKFVSTTNGDIGHYTMAGGPLAQRRTKEVRKAAKILGVETEVLDNHDGELMPTLENRKTIIRLIREWKADIVIGPRTNDYHPDHRYTAVLLQDAAFMVTVPYICPDIPRLTKNPVFLYASDRFMKPYPFEPDIVVDISGVAEKKIAAVSVLESQFLEWNPWLSGRLDEVPEDPEAAKAWVQAAFSKRFAREADKYRAELASRYGKQRAAAATHAEAFEIAEYGSQPSEEVIRKLFPFFPEK